MPATLATGGRIFSQSSSNATALAWEGGLITWVGQDAPATALFPTAARLDLAGDWVAPAFIECLPSGLDQELLTASGTVGTVGLRSEPVADLDEKVSAGERLIVDATYAVEFISSLVRVMGSAPAHRIARCAPTLLGFADLSDSDLAVLSSVGAAMVLRPLIDDHEGQDFVRVAAAGVLLATSLHGANRVEPWEALRRVTEVPHGRGLSPRAALTSATRGAARVAGAKDGLSGTIAPGAASSIARWSTGPLLVIAADDAVQRWSTDPRSGVPPMPDLQAADPILVDLIHVTQYGSAK